MGNFLSNSKETKALPIDTSFKLPSSLPSWPPGEGFGNGTIDLGGLQVCQISSFNKIWSIQEGGPDNLGASFFDPSQIPQGFFMLGSYSQSNNRQLSGWVLAAKDNENGALKQPIDYTLVFSSESLKIKQDRIGYIWLPTPPDGYKSVGLVVTNSPEKPSTEKVRCVRSDFVDQCETDSWIWGSKEQIDPNGFNIFSLRPSIRGTQAMGVSVGTFVAKNGNSDSPISLSCLKNTNNNLSFMPNKNQIQEIFQAYAPMIYFHPDEAYFTSSVNWYFSNGALLYKKGDESNPVKIEPNGSNLPQGGSNDGSYWLDLPEDIKAKELIKKGNLQETEVYLHVKPMFGATFSDIAIWFFYPFNGPAKAKIDRINLPLGMIGQHVGDWEHMTLRVSNFNGELRSVFFSQHSGGSWVTASELEFQNGNRIVGYSSLNGHAMYSKPGLVLQGRNGIGLRNDTVKSDKVLDTGAKFSVVAADYLGAGVVVEPPWVNYLRKWGPNISYEIDGEIKKVEKTLAGGLKSGFEKVVRILPREILGEEGPTGPKLKASWTGDER
ncbi:hypothetical protein At1g04090-like [Mercurialis annua]|uniref:hypothetical protein At1g04090-like n=1 Tax=Mercurialis annua TaxID=3986 RepID=UPI00215FCB67|nr:hypothetical protein At1g04090-like [Mercurialis annua]